MEDESKIVSDVFHPVMGSNLWGRLWLLPLVFVIHDGEELLTMPAWIAAHQKELERLSQLNETIADAVRSLPVTFSQAAVSIGIILLLFVGVTAGASLSKKRGFWLYAYAGLLGVLFLHVFTHLAQAIFFSGYVPGLIGAVLAVIPGSLYIYRILFQAGLLTWKSAIITALIGFILFVPGTLLAQQLGQMLAG